MALPSDPGLPGAEPAVALLRAGVAMDPGMQAPAHHALGVFQPGEDTPARRGSLFLLAEGNAGAGAGRLVVETAGEAFYTSPLRQPANLLQSALDQAGRRVAGAGAVGDPALLAGPCVCATAQGDALWLATVGVGHAYLLRAPGHLQALAGDAPAPTPAIFGPLPLQKGDLLVLCSAGVAAALDMRVMGDYLTAALLSTRTADPTALAADLVDGARFHGSADPLAVLVILCTDVLPEAVARAAGWPQAQARRLILPGGVDLSPSPPPLKAAGESPAVASRGASRPAPPAPTPPPPSEAEVGERSVGLGTSLLLMAGLVGVGLLGLATLGTALVLPPLLPAVAVLLLALAVPTGALFWSTARRLQGPARGGPGGTAGATPTVQGAPPARSPADRGLGTGRAARDPIAAGISALLPGMAGPPGADRGLGTPPADGTDPVSVALAAAMARARQQWLFNLFIAGASAGLVLAGCLLTAVAWWLGRGTAWEGLFGPGLGVLGLAGWLVSRPADQLARAGTQISLLTVVWVNYAQEMKACARIADPAAAAACNEHAAGQAVVYFQQIMGGEGPGPVPPPAASGGGAGA
jgi:hypothetical protein